MDVTELPDERLRFLNEQSPTLGDYVLYWMQQSTSQGSATPPGNAVKDGCGSSAADVTAIPATYTWKPISSRIGEGRWGWMLMCAAIALNAENYAHYLRQVATYR